MKIAFIGAQGVGKTTLCKAVAQKYSNSFIVRETVRECPYPCDHQADFKTEWWVLSHSILAEQEAREGALAGPGGKKKRKNAAAGGARKKEVSMDDMYHEGERHPKPKHTHIRNKPPTL